MATQEFSGLMKYKDADGNINLLLPITSKDNVDGLDEIENKLAEAVTYTKQTLTEEQKAQVRENIGVESQSKAFYVTVTGSESEGYTADKTYNEIITAYEADNVIFALGNTEEITANTYGNAPLILKLTCVDNNNGNGLIFDCLDYAYQTQLFISPDNSIMVSTETFVLSTDSIKNPYSLNFTGAVTGTYDGSKAVTIKIPTVDDILSAMTAAEEVGF